MHTVVIGSLNTDIIASGIEHFPSAGEQVYGEELIIGPGGKSRNIANMIAHLSIENSVAMIGRTAKDPYGLWRVPFDDLVRSTVNTDYIVIEEPSDAQKMPAVAFIPVGNDGNNRIILLPGVSSDFSVADIDNADRLFKEVGKNKGSLVSTLECPIETVAHAVRVANQHNMKVFLDPGGIRPNTSIEDLVVAGIYIIKPNIQEARALTDVNVTDFDSAKLAAERLQNQGIENVLITAGADGAYLFTPETREHFSIPKLNINSVVRDETGCGDQTMAVLCAFVQHGMTLVEATRFSIIAGTLQYHRLGIQPVLFDELMSATQNSLR